MQLTLEIDNPIPMVMIRNHSSLSLSGLSIFLLAGVLSTSCSDDDVDLGPTDSGVADSGVTDSGVADSGVPDNSLCPTPTAPTCQDESIQALGMSDTAPPGVIVEEGTNTGDTTHIDATAGGFGGGQGFLYARFTDTGLEKLELSDDDSFESTDWHIAFRRNVIRVNSGFSGPSCVSVARTATATSDFDSITAVDDNLVFRTESYMTNSCEVIADGNGLGSPALLLSGFWDYPGCLRMTGNVYIIRLPNNRHVKFEVLSYYTPANQVLCNTESRTESPTGSGNVRIRWAFID